MENYLDPTKSELVMVERRQRHKDRRIAMPGNAMPAQVREWCRGRNSKARLPIVAWFGAMFFCYVFMPERATVFDIINGRLHFFGHVLWGLFGGDLLAATGGLFAQFAAPCIAFEFCRRKSDYFLMATCVGWLGSNFLWNVTYARGAVDKYYPAGLEGLSEPLHDWWYIFNGLGNVELATPVSALLYLMGNGLMLLFGGMVGGQLYFMLTLEERRLNRSRRTDDEV